MKHAHAGTPYRVPPEPSRLPAILLAVAVHAVLLAFLWIGISWHNHVPVAVEAEVWDMKAEAAAPIPPPREAEPEPEPASTPPPKVVEQPVEKPAEQPDIALELEKKRKEEKLRKERELAEEKAREDARLKELAKKEAEKKKAEELAKLEKKKAEELAKKEADKKKADELAKKEAEKKEKAEKLAKAKHEAAEAAKREQLRKEDLQRMMAAAGSGGTGTAAKSSAPHADSSYVAAITAKVKSNTYYGGSTDVPGNPSVEFRVEQLPTGEIISVRKTRSSGNPIFDDAVEKGINKASPLPKKKDGTVERSLVIEFKMKDVT
ncbi:cell envelope integrity protein TolA [Massilia horti]|uniref:Cell envelope integrity protein TolA n=1 Tax=Massilia horti TaxID=2562153 RepID=A0A4Y9SWS9_9BURK|nr:cell envelope integrity protein TolA [Massilia horti]TFW31274.1 cell envelope integrity protein TolA [Massilia horti]